MRAILKKITPLYKIYLLQLKWRKRLIDRLTIPDYAVKRRTIIKLARKYNTTEVFIETGTYMGDTLEFLKDKFDLLYSIELNEDLANKAKQRFAKEEKITIVQGDSAEQLSSILSDIHAPVTFWLDGHYSSEFQVGDKFIVTGKGEKDTPILEELLQIKQHSVKGHVILIDDARLFNGTNDYPSKDEVRNFVSKELKDYRFSVKNDIIRILPNASGID